LGNVSCFFGRKRSADVGFAELSIRTSGGEERRAKLACTILPDGEIDCLVLGTEAQAKLRVIPNTVTGEPIFLE